MRRGGRSPRIGDFFCCKPEPGLGETRANGGWTCATCSGQTRIRLGLFIFYDKGMLFLAGPAEPDLTAIHLNPINKWTMVKLSDRKSEA